MSDLNGRQRSAYLYSVNVQHKLKEICEPLKHLGIDSFCYFKIFKDSSFLCLPYEYTAQVLKNFFSNVHDQGECFTSFIKETSQEYNYIFLSKYTGKDHFLTFLYDNNLWPIFVIGRKYNDYFEDFAFCLKPEVEKNAHVLLNNLGLLHKFIDYFKVAAKDLICCTDKSKLGYFKNAIDLNLKYKPTGNIELKPHFNARLNLEVKDSAFKFSPQEYRCIELWASGRSMKEIGYFLKISPRTVEDYIERIKFKTGCNYKSQIIDLFAKIK